MLVVPIPLIVTRFPVITATDGLDEVYETGNPDVDLPVRLKGGSTIDLSARSGNKIVLPTPGVRGGLTVIVCEIEGAGKCLAFPACRAVIVVVPSARKCSIPFSTTAMPGGSLVIVTGKLLLPP